MKAITRRSLNISRFLGVHRISVYTLFLSLVQFMDYNSNVFMTSRLFDSQTARWIHSCLFCRSSSDISISPLLYIAYPILSFLLEQPNTPPASLPTPILPSSLHEAPLLNIGCFAPSRQHLDVTSMSCCSLMFAGELLALNTLYFCRDCYV